MRTLPLLLLPLALAGCATGARQTAPTPGTWALQASATAGSSLTFPTPAGRDALRIACRRNPAELYVASDLAGPTAGPAILSVGRHSFPLAGATGEPRFSATGAVPAGLPAALLENGEIALQLQGRRMGPYPAPDAKQTASFAIACRALGG
jgi:hypothetical protein